MSAEATSVAWAVVGGAIRISTPFLFVSLGECLTEKSGRVNLGLEGTLVMGAMSAYGISYLTGSPWLGVLTAGAIGTVLGAMHGWLCGRPRVNDVAVGIAMMLFGVGLAFFLGKPLIGPTAPHLPAIPLGFWSSSAAVRSALQVNVLFVAGVGGSFLSLFYPGSWNEGLSSGQGLMAVALVIFARWDPIRCLWASLLFGGASALGPALQSVGVTSGYYLFNAAPYVLTLAIMVATSSATRTLAGQPAELTAAR